MYFLESLNQIVKDAFMQAGFGPEQAKIVVSSRPDLCEYQCNGAMALAKAEHCAPIQIANKIADVLKENPAFSKVEAVMPGFININVSETYLADFLCQVGKEEKFGYELPEKKTIMVDYGGPNVAKPLHIGHLRSAIIGESVKRILKFVGNDVIGDTHLGDWGLQIGQIIEELKFRKPDLCYFDPNFKGPYPTEAPFTISELEEIYPCASGKCKVDEAFKERAHENTFKLQNGDPAFRAIWGHIIAVSVADLKKNYDNLNVHFELWKAESDAQPYIPQLIQTLEEQKLSYLSDGAVVVDVQEETDKHEVPPCLIIKSDGAALYQTTDLATIIDRMKTYHPQEMVYITDKRQELHFTQVFRVAKKAHLVDEDTDLIHIGFGTMNGKDGKPFKTREGGVMRLETLIAEIQDAVAEKMKERYQDEELNMDTVKAVSLAAIKYGDLSNQATKDYNFDIDRFASFDGNTGPYILYTIVRIKSILRKAGVEEISVDYLKDLPQGDVNQKNLLKQLCGFSELIKTAAEELAPHKICGYIFNLCDAFNSFYHDTHILNEENKAVQNAYFALLCYTKKVLECAIDMLGFSAPDKM